MSGWGSRAIRDKLKRKRCPPGILSQQQGASARLSFLSVFYSANFHYGAPRTCAVPAGLWSKINRVSIFHHLFLLKFAFFLFLSLVLISSPPPLLSVSLPRASHGHVNRWRCLKTPRKNFHSFVQLRGFFLMHLTSFFDCGLIIFLSSNGCRFRAGFKQLSSF